MMKVMFKFPFNLYFCNICRGILKKYRLLKFKKTHFSRRGEVEFIIFVNFHLTEFNIQD